MAVAKPWFGWGMASYPFIFTMFNTRVSGSDGLPVFYHDAHSDWLQSFAEHGLIGSALLASSVLVPLIVLRFRPIRSQLAGYLMGGCGLVLVYAFLEFPFGNFAVVLVWWLCFMVSIQYTRLRQFSAAEQSGGEATDRDG
jgi:O-antigen ligase